MAERVTFVLIPPLGLIFLVLGTIFLGIATPTEGGAMGAVGALLMAISRGRLSRTLLGQAMDSTMKLSCFVVFILVGSTVFSLTFQGVDGPKWVEHLLTSLPGGQLGFLIVVNLLVFVLAFFLDFFELSFIVVPLLGPVAEKLGIDLVWFGVLLAVNMQTSFMHPPFGFALFYLRSVAPNKEYKDRVTGRPTAPVTTSQIYWGSVPFVLIQILMVGLIITFPNLVSGGLDKKAEVNVDDVQIEMQADTPKAEDDPMAAFKDMAPASDAK
jgi:GntP family gluconate:H+ symporter